MTENECKRYELHARLKRYQNLVFNTERFIQEALRKVQTPYVACSFGKDSSVLLHLVVKFSPNIVVRFAIHPETQLLDDYQSVTTWWIENYGINLQEVYCDGGLLKIKHHQRESLNAGEWDSFLLGIRAEESQARMFSLKKYGTFHQLKNGRIKISPLAWWKEEDVAAYMRVHKLPLLRKYILEGINARTTSGVPRTHIVENLASLKKRDIDAFNKLCALFEDARYYI